ncbi:MAG: hypothetical protein QXD23_02515, partial [Candidatus Micrarchaeaceae archaeon]
MSIIQKIFAGRWIVGSSTKEVISKAVILSKINLNSMINYLGEDIKDLDSSKKAVNIYLKLLKEINKNKINSSIAIKPTQIGLLISKELLNKNYYKIIKEAKKNNIFVW